MLKGKLILKRAIRKPNAGKKLLDLLWHICSKLSRNPKKRRDISEKTAMRRWKGWQVFQSWKGTRLFDLWLSELFRKYFQIGGDRWILVREDLEDPGQRKGSSYLKISSTVLPRSCFSCLELFFFFGSTCRFFFKTKAFNFRCASICYIHHIIISMNWFGLDADSSQLGLRHDSLFIVFNFEYISLLQDEVMNLAEKYGRLQKCAVQTRKELHGDEAVRVFLEFETSQHRTNLSLFESPQGSLEPATTFHSSLNMKWPGYSNPTSDIYTSKIDYQLIVSFDL